MKAVNIILSFLSIFVFQIEALKAQTPQTDPHFYIIFEDDFNFLDLTKWDVWNNVSWAPSFTNRIDNIQVSNGQLDQINRIDNFNGLNYTSALIESHQSFSVGSYFECYSKIPEGRCSPAFWLWDGDGDCTDGPNFSYREIDIMEWLGSVGYFSGNLHWCSEPYILDEEGNLTLRKYNEFHYTISNTFDYHLYAGFWTEDIAYIINDNITMGERRMSPTILTQPMRLVNNNNVHAKQTDYIDPNTFPMTYTTDYIRVYRLYEDCETVILNIADFSTYNYAIKKWMIFNDGSNFPTNQETHLRANEFIEFWNGFEIDNGVEVSFNTNICYD